MIKLYFGGKRYDRLIYGLLAKEYLREDML